MEKAEPLAGDVDGIILAVKPTYPATCYGYIEAGKPIPSHDGEVSKLKNPKASLINLQALLSDLMLKENILIEAEESGGIGVQGHIPERDGILNSLLLLESVEAGCKIPPQMVRDIHREFGEFYFDRRDIKMEVAWAGFCNQNFVKPAGKNSRTDSYRHRNSGRNKGTV